ncbi:MAG: glycosyltransferase family 9 protein [Phycisphaerales bacterium]
MNEPKTFQNAPKSRPTLPIRRLLVVMPSWVGDAVMATPSLRVLRELLPGAFIAGLMRPGIDDLLRGTSFFDEIHVARSAGVMGPKRVASQLRPRQYDTALLLTGSFSTALITRIAGIPRRVGYDRDGRGLLLTDGLQPLRRRDVEPYSRSSTDPSGWAPVAACDYYYALTRYLLASHNLRAYSMGPLELATGSADERAADALLERAGVAPGDRQRMILLNPGGNKDEKRWPVERFAALADHLIVHHRATILINGSPKEAELVRSIMERIEHRDRVVSLPELGMDLSLLKTLVKRCKLMVTNDTGPRHIAAAFGVPVVTLFGPTDHRWTTIPFEDEVELLADPSLPEEEVSNDHPERCRIERISLEDVVAAASKLLSGVGAN